MENCNPTVNNRQSNNLVYRWKSTTWLETFDVLDDLLMRRACAQRQPSHLNQAAAEAVCLLAQIPACCRKVDDMKSVLQARRPLTRCTPIHHKGLRQFGGLVCTQVIRGPYFLFRLIEQLSKQGWLHLSPAGQKTLSYPRSCEASWKHKRVLAWISDLLLFPISRWSDTVHGKRDNCCRLTACVEQWMRQTPGIMGRAFWWNYCTLHFSKFIEKKRKSIYVRENKVEKVKNTHLQHYSYIFAFEHLSVN